MKTFKQLIGEAEFRNAYKINNNEFDGMYNRYNKVKNGITTHVYDGNRKIATYNHVLGNLLTNHHHDEKQLV